MRHTLMEDPEQLNFHYDNGKVVVVRMSNAGEFVQYVRVYDLPPEVPDANIELVLSKYGKVKRVVREKFPPELNFDMYTGVRGAYVDVKKQIPTSLHFLNRKGNVFYHGNKNVCFHCKTEGHRMDSCPKRQVRKQPERQEPTESQDKAKIDQVLDEDQSISSLDTTSFASTVAKSAARDIVVEDAEVLDGEVMAIDEEDLESEEQAEQSIENQTQGRVRFDYRKDPAYLMANEIWKKHEEKQKEEKRKAKAREKAGSKKLASKKK